MLLAILLAASTGLVTWHIRQPGTPGPLLRNVVVLWVLFAAAVIVLRGIRRPAIVVLLGAAVLQIAALSAPPHGSDDSYRYVWDGRVQAAGIDPYRYSPTEPELAALRDDFLFPDDATCAQRDRQPGCTRMNHPDAHTIYPPVAQAYFTAVHLVSFGHPLKALQVAGALLSFVVTGLLVRSSGPWRAALWGWCPTVALEIGNDAHVDVLGALLVLIGLSLAGRRRLASAGIVLGAAVAVKLLPVLVLPTAVRRGQGPPWREVAQRRTWILPGAAVATVALVYLPHLLAVGTDVLGFLPGYLEEEGLHGSSRYALLAAVLPDEAAHVTAVLVLVAVAVLAWWRADPRAPEVAAGWTVAVAFLVLVPEYPWYALLVVALAARTGRWEWLAVALAGYPVYLSQGLPTTFAGTRVIAYTLALLVVVAVPIGFRRRRLLR